MLSPSRIIPALFLTLLIVSSTCKTAEEDPTILTHEQGVVDLTDDTFYDFIRDNKNVIVLFRNRTCEDCPQIQEDLRVSINKFAPAGVKWTLGRLNVHKYHQFMKVLHMLHFPKVRFYFDNEFHTTLHQPNTQVHIEAFLSEIAKINSKPEEIKTKADFDEFRAKNLAVYLSFPEINERNVRYAEQLQKVYPDIPVHYALTHSDFDKTLFSSEKPAYKVLLQRKFDNGDRETTSHILNQPEAVINLIAAFRHERVRQLDEETLDQIMTHEHGFTVVFDKDLSSEHVNNVRDLMLSQLYSGLILKANLKKGSPGRDLARELGIKKSDLPVFLIVKNYPTRFQKYKYTGDFTSDSLKSFLSDYVAGKVPEFFRSEAEPEQKSRKPHELVPSTFHKFIKSAKTHVLVLFYKQHHHKSSELRHELHEAIKQLESHNNVTAVQTDAGMNDYEFLNHRELPLLYLYPLDRKDKPIVYSDRVNDEYIIKFLGNELEAYMHRKHPQEIEHEWDL